MIKIIAIASMIIGHIGYLYFPQMDTLSAIGRLAFPLFAWGIASGFKHTGNFKKYIGRVFLIAVISQYPYHLMFDNNYLNVCFTLFAGLILLKVYEASFHVFMKILLIILIFIFVDIFSFEYGMYGLATVLIFYIFSLKPYSLFFHLTVTLLGIHFYNYSMIQLFSVSAFFVLIFFYKSEFRINRYLSYGFYPLHLVIFLVVKDFFGK